MELAEWVSSGTISAAGQEQGWGDPRLPAAQGGQGEAGSLCSEKPAPIFPASNPGCFPRGSRVTGHLVGASLWPLGINCRKGTWDEGRGSLQGLAGGH